MKRHLTGPDSRLLVLLRIKEARQGLSRQQLSSAIDVEQQRVVAESRAQEHHNICASKADGYVRNRFATKGDIADVGRFFQSVALGSYEARRDAARAQLVVERVSFRRGAATREREDAAQRYVADMRTTEGLEQFVEQQTIAANLANEIRDDDDMHEIHAARGLNGKAQ